MLGAAFQKFVAASKTPRADATNRLVDEHATSVAELSEIMREFEAEIAMQKKHAIAVFKTFDPDQIYSLEQDLAQIQKQIANGWKQQERNEENDVERIQRSIEKEISDFVTKAAKDADAKPKAATGMNPMAIMVRNFLLLLSSPAIQGWGCVYSAAAWNVVHE